MATLVLTWVLVHICLTLFRDVPVFEGGLIDPDSYMRLVRVQELVQGWDWFDSTIARANAPYGDTLHWTRPFDLLILLLALPASLVLELERAIFVAGLAVSPLLQLATVLLLVWALRPAIRPAFWFLPALALFLQPGALSYSLVGRADHHAFLLLVFVVTAGFTLRALRNKLDARPALGAGLAAGFGVWLSVEFLLVVGACFAALGLAWLSGERERAQQSKWCALGMSLVLLVALFVERPLAQAFDVSYDSVSSVQYLLAVGMLVFWQAVEVFEARSRRGPGLLTRAALAAAGAAAVALLVGGVYPLFFAGPMAEVDPRIVPIWLDRVLEMRPLIPDDRDTLGRFIFYLGGLVLVSLPFLKILAEERGSPRFFAYLFIALACLLLGLVTVAHMRFSIYAEGAFVMAFAVVLDRFLQWSGHIANNLLRGVLRGAFISVVLMGPILVGGSLMAKDTASDPGGQPLTGCKVRDMAAYLENDPQWRAEPQTLLAFMDIGPELLYRTHHRVIGTPYHRNGEGIYDGYRILATDDLAAARSLMAQRGVDLVMLCLSPPERSFYARADGKENLYQRLAEGRPPAWLAPVALPGELAGQALLYRVLR
ncbi:MAG: hypothetical protein Kow00114_29110 [Kiloniellaceae bacterium]